MPELTIKQTLSPSGDKFTLDLTMLGPKQVAVEDEAAVEEEDA